MCVFIVIVVNTMTAALCLAFADKQCLPLLSRRNSLEPASASALGAHKHAIAEAVSIPASQLCVTISTEYVHAMLAVVSDTQLAARCKLNDFVAMSNSTNTNVPRKADVTHSKPGQPLVGVLSSSDELTRKCKRHASTVATDLAWPGATGGDAANECPTRVA